MQDPLGADNFVFDVNNMKKLQSQQDKLTELQQRRTSIQQRKDELEMELYA